MITKTITNEQGKLCNVIPDRITETSSGKTEYVYEWDSMRHKRQVTRLSLKLEILERKIKNMETLISEVKETGVFPDKKSHKRIMLKGAHGADREI